MSHTIILDFQNSWTVELNAKCYTNLFEFSVQCLISIVDLYQVHCNHETVFIFFFLLYFNSYLLITIFNKQDLRSACNLVASQLAS